MELLVTLSVIVNDAVVFGTVVTTFIGTVVSHDVLLILNGLTDAGTELPTLNLIIPEVALFVKFKVVVV